MADVVDSFNYSATELIEAYDGNIGQAAAAMAGVPYQRGVSKNLAYKAAIRNLQRYLKGRTPLPDQQLKMNRAGNKGQGRQVTYDGQIRVNGYVRDRTITQNYSPADMEELLELAANGDATGVWDAIAEMYGGTVWEMEVEDGTIDIE